MDLRQKYGGFIMRRCAFSRFVPGLKPRYRWGMQFDVYAMGFSNRSWENTLEILHAFSIKRVVDIRTLPGSKHTPQFNLQHMKDALPTAGIDYVHLKGLGGFRKPVKGSDQNAAWQNSGFRGYADYMQTDAFRIALEQLIELLQERLTVYCCTEGVFWRCHRQLVSDALVVRGYRVGNIFGPKKVEFHELTEILRVEDGRMTYPPPQKSFIP
jgi:uncharacterized protein (DUF488 family)